jgi:multiple RNA-binding domain-containing protein 1
VSLLGRHLVLEWAEEAEQDLDTQAGVGFGSGKEMPGRKKRLDMELGTGGTEDGDEE